MAATPRGWAEFESDDYGPTTPAAADAPYGWGKQAQQPPSPTTSTVASSLGAASSLLARVPGAKTVGLCNATLLGVLGLLAVVAAWWGGFSMLLVLAARWYLPALDAHHALPLHFDYAAAAPGQAAVWLPLLRPTPTSASLAPPRTLTPANVAGLSLSGSLAPGSSLSVSSSDGGGAAAGRGGFLGLGLGPLHARGPARRAGLLARLFGRRSRRLEAAAASAAAAAGVDVGSGILVPEADWLVPLWGHVRLGIELELPGWPAPDLVQVTSELFSQHGISLGRWTRTWLDRPRPLLLRALVGAATAPWRALGLVDDTVRVQLPMFEGFQNPAPPPGGWGSLPGFVALIRHQQQQVAGAAAWPQQQGAAGPGAAGRGAAGPSAAGPGAGPSSGAREADDGPPAGLAGPRAMWLRVTLTGRSPQDGAPRVYRARAKLDMRLSFLDRLASSLRPSLGTSLLLIAAGIGLLVGGTGSAAVLLLLAYLIWRWSSSIGAGTGAGHRAGKRSGVAGSQDGADGEAELYQEPEASAAASSPFGGAYFADAPHGAAAEPGGSLAGSSSGGSGDARGLLPLAARASRDGGASISSSGRRYYEPQLLAVDTEDLAPGLRAVPGPGSISPVPEGEGGESLASLEGSELQQHEPAYSGSSSGGGDPDRLWQQHQQQQHYQQQQQQPQETWLDAGEGEQAASAGGGGGGVAGAIWRMLGLGSERSGGGGAAQRWDGSGGGSYASSGTPRGWGHEAHASQPQLQQQEEVEEYQDPGVEGDTEELHGGPREPWQEELLAESDGEEPWQQQQQHKEGGAPASEGGSSQERWPSRRVGHRYQP